VAKALGQLIQGLGKLSTLELMSVSHSRDQPTVELGSIMDELRILLASTCDESGIELDWPVVDDLPMVTAERYGLMQVFLNLVKNFRRAMEHSMHKRLRVENLVGARSVEIRLKDTGPGIANLQLLFRPFQRGGLLVSRALMRSFGGDLVHELSPEGCCFAVILPKAEQER